MTLWICKLFLSKQSIPKRQATILSGKAQSGDKANLELIIMVFCHDFTFWTKLAMGAR